ncbi:MAG: hypothetical protein CVT89_03320, partial [Candidatus Altiarchaeales archaeon HGW-Altiarchaeales-2]
GSEKEITEVAKELIDIEKHLKPKHIIYFEDPFGKTKTVYERRDVLRERIKAIINSVKNTKDCYVIITSRKDVFGEFKKESLTVEEIENFEKELNIIKPSYAVKKRQKILEEWANEKGCKWFKDEKLRSIVFNALADEKKLPTPLNIHDFVQSTIQINDETELKREIDKYSQEGERAFADEIKGLYESGRKDRVLFLSFIFVSEDFEKEFVKQEYEKLKKENFEDFEKILKEEYRVKEEEEEFFGKRRVLKFSHPSYSQAIPYVLEDVVCRKIFCNVLKELAKKDSAAWYVARAVANNFEKLPDDVRNLLFELAEKDSAARDVARAIVDNFDKLPEDVRNLLFELAKKDSAVRDVAQAVANNFNKLPDDVRNKLLFELAKKDSAAWYVAQAVAENFDKLPEDVRNL